ncbi:MAG TPA: HepT-like ribonuclease domain-containing protein, partial [Streptosporangiaceae bacterium]|nr:HepT-like ribonuclease domain-containing protein [Streptosporangiaceae bacterium]
VKALPAELLDSQPEIPWRQIARMRDHLAHRYFDTAHAILQATVDDDLPDLERGAPRTRWQGAGGVRVRAGSVGGWPGGQRRRRAGRGVADQP